MESEARKLGKLENWNSLLGSSSSLELMRRARFGGRMMKGPGKMCVCAKRRCGGRGVTVKGGNSKNAPTTCRVPGSNVNDVCSNE